MDEKMPVSKWESKDKIMPNKKQNEYTRQISKLKTQDKLQNKNTRQISK